MMEVISILLENKSTTPINASVFLPNPHPDCVRSVENGNDLFQSICEKGAIIPYGQFKYSIISGAFESERKIIHQAVTDPPAPNYTPGVAQSVHPITQEVIAFSCNLNKQVILEVPIPACGTVQVKVLLVDTTR